MDMQMEGNKEEKTTTWDTWIEGGAEILVRIIGIATCIGVEKGIHLSGHIGVANNDELSVSQSSHWIGDNMSDDYLRRNYANLPPPHPQYSLKLLVIILTVISVVMPLIALPCYLGLNRDQPNKIRFVLLELKQYALGLTGNVIFLTLWVEILKKFVQRPRPDFFYQCNVPPGSHYEAPFSPTAPSFPWQPLPDKSDKRLSIRQVRPTCMRPPEGGQNNDTIMSFPSGHAATSISVFLFIILWILYLFKRHKFLRGPLIWSGLMAIAFPAVISASRIYDNRHHPSDVVFGWIFGIFFAVVSIWYYFGSPLDLRVQPVKSIPPTARSQRDLTSHIEEVNQP